MAFLQELKRNRLKLLKLFLSDRELVNLISNNTTLILPALETLGYKQVFPYPWIDKTVTEEKVFFSFSLTAKRGMSSKGVTKDISMHIWVFMHKNLMKMQGGLRSDEIASRIEELLNGDETYGVSDVEFDTLNDISNIPESFYGCYLKYSVKDINNLCGSTS